MRAPVDTTPKPNGESGARAPAGSVIYAVGDIHGRRDLLTALHAQIIRDSAERASGERKIVYLGDYIDRGPDSAGVIDLLLDHPLPGFDAVYLLGNHERLVLDFLISTEVTELWFSNGGQKTLESYGVPAHGDPRALQDALRARLPARHLAFLEGLQLKHVEGDYAFVHAGIRPGKPLEAQDESDLIWIRKPFLLSTADHGKIIVHGHTITQEPVIAANRIGIDTGAYRSGRLTALALEDNRRDLLHTVG